MDVRVEVEGEVTPGPTMEQVLEGLAGDIAEAFAEVVRERVSTRGDLAGQRSATLKRTGGMWDGLTTLKLGSTAEVLFRGSSLGKSGKPITNAEKAASVLLRGRVNPLLMREDELEGIADGVCEALARSMGAELPIIWRTPMRSANGDIAGAIAAAMRGL